MSRGLPACFQNLFMAQGVAAESGGPVRNGGEGQHPHAHLPRGKDVWYSRHPYGIRAQLP
jgi:hypothetical protein